MRKSIRVAGKHGEMFRKQMTVIGGAAGILLLYFLLFVIQYRKTAENLASNPTGAGNALPMTWLIFSLGLLLIILTAVFLFLHPQKPEKTFAVLALVTGLLFMFAITPLAVPDEAFHYQSAYEMSNALLFRWNQMDMGDAQHFDYSGFPGHVNTSAGYERILKDFFAVPKTYQEIKIPETHGIGYPLMILPPAIGIALGRLLGGNFCTVFYLARLCNLLFYTACVYFAIRETPKYKLLFFITGIMPMAMHQAASCSYDAFINGMALLFISLVLKEAEDRSPITIRRLLPAFISAALLVPAKLVYTPVIFLLFMIPARKFGGQRKYLASVFGMTVLIIGFLFLIQSHTISAVAFDGNAAQNWEGGHNYSTAFILSHPMETIKIFITTVLQNGPSWIMQTAGWVLAGQNLFVNRWAIVLYLVLLCLSALRTEPGETKTSVRDRCLFLISFVSISVLIMLSMFLGWTTDTRETIQGIQGRYFIPVVPLVGMSIHNQRIAIRKNIDPCVMGVAVLIHLWIVTDVLFMTLRGY